jgi:hypothetical protein
LAQRITCDDPQKLMSEIELIFGRNIGGKVGVTEEQWTKLVAGEITPRFPDELSMDDCARLSSERVIQPAFIITRIVGSPDLLPLTK